TKTGDHVRRSCGAPAAVSSFPRIVRNLLVAACWGQCLSGVTHATPMVIVGTHLLLPNERGQTIQLFVSGGDPVAGLNGKFMTGDGGTAAGGTRSAPAITSVDVVTGTIFAGNSIADAPGLPGFFSSRQYWEINNITIADTVAADGLLATLTI